MMDFLVKKTFELSDLEKNQINDLFNVVFEKSRTIVELSNQFTNNPFGYSYHALMVDNGLVVGHNSGIPCYYIVNNQKQTFICNVDTMIEKEHRGIENFYDLMNTAYENYAKDGITFVYGFPNDNSYPLLSQLSFMEDIGKMDTYCLPIRIGGIKSNLKWLNWLSIAFCWSWLKMSCLFASGKRASFVIEKEAESYNQTRYKRSDGDYSIVKEGTLNFVYKIIEYEGIRTAFLIDVIGKSSKQYCKAINYIFSKEYANCDLIIYVGHLPFSNNGMVKVPRKYEPKHFNFTGKLFNSNQFDSKNLYDIENWDVNLSNYDLI